jgi:hypothetical protein
MKISTNRILFLLLPIVIAVVTLLMTFNGCKSDYSSVTFAIQENGQTYLYNSNEYLVRDAIEKDEMPFGLNNNIIYIIDDYIYMRPNSLKDITNILSENYILIEKKEPSHSGYAVSDSAKVHYSTVRNKASSEIGQVESTNIVTISYKSIHSKTMHIKWRTLPDPKAIENCNVEGVWKTTNPYPGKTVTNLEDEVVVKINDLNSFYGNPFELVFDEESSVLYFKRKKKN